MPHGTGAGRTRGIEMPTLVRPEADHQRPHQFSSGSRPLRRKLRLNIDMPPRQPKPTHRAWRSGRNLRRQASRRQGNCKGDCFRRRAGIVAAELQAHAAGDGGRLAGGTSLRGLILYQARPPCHSPGMFLHDQSLPARYVVDGAGMGRGVGEKGAAWHQRRIGSHRNPGRLGSSRLLGRGIEVPALFQHGGNHQFRAALLQLCLNLDRAAEGGVDPRQRIKKPRFGSRLCRWHCCQPASGEAGHPKAQPEHRASLKSKTNGHGGDPFDRTKNPVANHHMFVADEDFGGRWE